MEQLGEKTYLTVISFKADDLTEHECGKLIEKIIEEICMTKAYEPMIYRFPMNGKGGKGYTYLQSITESYIVVDYWLDLKGGYLSVCSCRKYDPKEVKDVVIGFGLEIINILSDSVGIVQEVPDARNNIKEEE